MSIRELLEPVGRDGPQKLPHGENWMQGRTFYGGLSGLIAYTDAQRRLPDLPPLRSAQIDFVGPVGGEVETTSQIIRQGRNVTHVRTDIACEGNLALTAIFLFGASREPNALYPAKKAEDWPGAPEENEVLPGPPADKPHFVQNYEIRRAQDVSGPGEPLMRRWSRLKEDPGLDPIGELIVMGDALPPSAIRVMQRQGPLSSINWSFNVLTPNPTTRDRFYLAEAAAQWADDGFSSERLRLYNSEGEQMLDGIQCAALFG
jgi:acyl-CoA thioesterase